MTSSDEEEDEEALERTRRALLRLPPRTRTMVLRFYGERMSLDRIAAELGASRADVIRELARASGFLYRAIFHEQPKELGRAWWSRH